MRIEINSPRTILRKDNYLVKKFKRKLKINYFHKEYKTYFYNENNNINDESLNDKIKQNPLYWLHLANKKFKDSFRFFVTKNHQKMISEEYNKTEKNSLVKHTSYSQILEYTKATTSLIINTINEIILKVSFGQINLKYISN